MAKPMNFNGSLDDGTGTLIRVPFTRSEVSGITTLVHDDGSTHHYANLHNFRQVEIEWEDALSLRRVVCQPSMNGSKSRISNAVSR